MCRSTSAGTTRATPGRTPSRPTRRSRAGPTATGTATCSSSTATPAGCTRPSTRTRTATARGRPASGAVFDLRSNRLRPAGWTSADAAGLPILAGLVRYDEVAAGKIDHAIRVTVPESQKAYVWPARHQAGSSTDPNLPPMGLRLRLKAGFDISGFDRQARVVLQAAKTYGLIVADNGSPWFMSGVPDERWDNDVLHTLRDVPGSAFEAVDASGLMVSGSSAATG